MKENAEKARALDTSELSKQVKDTSEQMFRLRFQMTMGQMDGIKKLRSLRKERARMLTVLRERQDGAAVIAPRPERAKSTPKAAVKSGEVKKAATVAKPPVLIALSHALNIALPATTSSAASSCRSKVCASKLGIWEPSSKCERHSTGTSGFVSLCAGG